MTFDELYAFLKEKFEDGKVSVLRYRADDCPELTGPVTKIKIDKLGGKTAHYLDYYNEKFEHHTARYISINAEASLTAILQALLSIGLEVEVLYDNASDRVSTHML